VTVARTFIVSEEALRELLEAHGSLASSYYELWRAVQAPGTPVREPPVALRAAYVAELGRRHAELRPLSESLTAPRFFVPPPIHLPASAEAAPPPPEAATPQVEPPPLVDATKIRFE
jgi:hypothetical protein